MRSLSREEIRGLDCCAIETVGVPGVVLMENAGRNAAGEIEKFLQAAAGRSIAIVAGAGNNGGDGFVIARHLAMRAANVVTFLVVAPEKVSGDAKINLDILNGLGHDVREAVGSQLAALAESLRAFDLIVDAVGGTGIRGALKGHLATAVEQINAAARPVVAVDIPTGLDCDTGQAPGPVIRAEMTVTMLARKKGFDADGAEDYTGEVRVVDIGIPPELVAKIAGSS